MAFNKVNHVKNLPDTYRKDKDSNNYKILEIERDAVSCLNDGLLQVFDVLDLDKATGKSLDLYGEDVGQARGESNDEQYRVLIRAKAVRNLVDGSYESVCRALCITFGCDRSDIVFRERLQACSLQAEFSIMSLVKADFTLQQMIETIESLLPICVTLDIFVLNGSFTFGKDEYEMSDIEGFTDVEGGTIGGMLGGSFKINGKELIPI